MTVPEGNGVEFARGASTLIEVLEQAGASGFGGGFEVESSGVVSCAACGGSSPAGELDVVRTHRLEGASDVADELIVILARCPLCGSRGTLTLGYGPSATEQDAAVATRLDLSHREYEP